MKIIIVSLLASCAFSLAQTNTDSSGYVTNASWLPPFTVTNSAGEIFTNAVLVQLTTNKFIYKTPGGAMGMLPLDSLPEDLQARIGFKKLPQVASKSLAVTRIEAQSGDVNAMVTLGDNFYIKWQNDFSEFLTTNNTPIDPKTGLPTGAISAKDSVNYVKSMEWYEKAATLGSTNAMWKIIENDDGSDVVGAYISPETGLPMRKERLRWLRKLAQNGDSAAVKTVKDFDSQANQVPGASPQPDLEIVNLSTKVMEANDQWWRWSYQLKARNNTAQPIHEFPHLQFLDAQGFIIAEKTCEVKLSAYETKTFLGTTLVELPGAARVKTIKTE